MKKDDQDHEADENDDEDDNGISFPSGEFSDIWKQTVEHDLLTSRQRQSLLEICARFLHRLIQSLNKRFPECQFIVQDCSILDPRRRENSSANITAVIDRFNNGFMDGQLVARQYGQYMHEDDVDFILQENDVNVVSFWCDLFLNYSGCKELSKLSVLLLSLSPNTCDCERGFSVLNFVKNEYRCKLTSENVNACIAVGMERRTVDDFPFVKFVK